MTMKGVFNYVNKNEYQVTKEIYNSKLELLKNQAVASVRLAPDNYINEIISKAHIQGDLYTDISFGDIEIIKLYDDSYVLFIEFGAMSGNFEHLCFYVVENAPLSIINKLKKYI